MEIEYWFPLEVYQFLLHSERPKLWSSGLSECNRVNLLAYGCHSHTQLQSHES